jgi:hypothetical protein
MSNSNELLRTAIEATGLITVKDVCARAGIHRETLMKHVKAGHILARKERMVGRDVILFEKPAVEAYVSKLPSLRINTSSEMLREARNLGLVTAKQLSEAAGVSLPTINSHMKRSLLRGERRRINGRTMLVFERAEAERYASVASDIVAESTEDNQMRGQVKAPPGYMTAAGVASQSRRSIDFIYNRIKAGDMKAAVLDGAIMIRDDEAARFVARFGLSSAPAGMVTIPEAGKATGLDATSIVNAIDKGYVAAIPADRVTATGRSTGRAKTLVSMEDVRQFSASSNAARQRQREIMDMIRTGHQITKRMNNE